MADVDSGDILSKLGGGHEELDTSEYLSTPRECAVDNMMGEQPEYYGDIYDALVVCLDPALLNGIAPQDGQLHQDEWGTTWMFPVGAPGQHPRTTDENAVVKDITKWEEQIRIPPVEGLDWSIAKKMADETDRKEKFVSFMFAGGLFERSHHLMGMENALCAYLEEPESMKDMLRAIADYKIAYIKEAAYQIHPDLIFYHDDWGSKQNLFLPPAVWREIIKPLQQEISDAIHDCGMVYMHHADCICQPIVEDMVDLGIDLWQGAIAQNDIPQIQARTHMRLPIEGGIDGPAMDIEHITEEEIRTMVDDEIDRCCKHGKFFPGIPNGDCFREWNNTIVHDEIRKFGYRYAQERPIVPLCSR